MNNHARNAAIVEMLKNETSANVAAKFKLSPSRIRSIKREYQQIEPERVGRFGEIGVSGLNFSRGFIHEEFLRDLNSSAKRYRAFNEMRQNSAIVAAALVAWELSIRRVNWRVEGEDERQEFIEGAMADMSHSWNDHISELSNTVPTFGWAWFETVYKRRRGPLAKVPSNFGDGKIGWRKLAFRSQDSLLDWRFDEKGNVQAMVQQTWPDWKTHVIPLEKSILYRMSLEKNNPEGRSLLRPAYPSYYYAKNLRTIEAIGAERDVAGLPVVELPEGAGTKEGDADVAKAENLARRIRIDELGGVVQPFGWGVKLLSAAGSKQYDIGSIISRYETRIAMTLLAQFLLLGTGDVGSFALSKDQSNFFVMAVSAFADIIGETFSKFAIAPLLKLNGMDLVNPPFLTHDALGTPDLDAIGNYFARLMQVGGIKPGVDLEQFFREQADAPVLTPEEIERREEEREAMAKLRERIPEPSEEKKEDEEDDEKEPPSEMTLGSQAKRYAARQSTVNDKINSIPDEGVRNRIKRGARRLREIDEEAFAEARKRLLDTTDAEWQAAVEAEKRNAERRNGSN